MRRECVCELCPYAFVCVCRCALCVCACACEPTKETHASTMPTMAEPYGSLSAVPDESENENEYAHCARACANACVSVRA